MYQPSQFGPEYAIEDMLVAHLKALSFVDVSWGNNICPSFHRERPYTKKSDLQIIVWIDAKYKKDREYPEATRFMVQVREEGKVETFESVVIHKDDFWELLPVLRGLLNKYDFHNLEVDSDFGIQKKVLSNVHELLIGGDPFEMDPSITQMTVARLLSEYLSDAIYSSLSSDNDEDIV